MAEEEEEIVILEGGGEEKTDPSDEIVDLELDIEDEESSVIDKELSNPEYQEEAIEDEKREKKRNLYIIIGIALLVVIIAVLIILIISNINKPEDNTKSTDELVKKIQKKEKTTIFTPSKIDNMLQRANVLYEQGNKMEALNIYENIATYNEAISQYNMGVAQMKEGNFQQALVSFKNAILNKEKRTVSAINGAICALKLNDKALFDYYLDLAHTYLPEESNAPLYSYYAGLINFYKGDYYESLSAFTHPSTKYYGDRQNYLSSKIYSFLDNPYNAIESIEPQKRMQNNLSLGLLYARIGEYKISKTLLEKAIKNLVDTYRATMALVFVDMKLGNFQSAASALTRQYDTNKTRAISMYPIKATLNNSLFNVHLAQEQFMKNSFYSKKNQYALLFYFAPYKVFDAKQTISMIRKGGLNVFVDEIQSGMDYLKTSSTMAKINASMSKSIKTALNHHYLQANIEFKELIKTYSKHAILHYNLALTYAQLGNYTKSYKHFSASYRLDHRNYLAGLFAVMSSELIGRDSSKLLESVKKDIDSDESLEKINFFMTIAHLIDNNQLSMNRWLELDKDKSPLHIMFDIITANATSNSKVYLEKSQELKDILPNDIMANIIYFNSKYDIKDSKEYAKMIQMDFVDKKFDISSFYYGSSLVKEQYVKMLQISGLLYNQRDRLKKRLEVEQDDVVGVMQALAYIDLYTGDFEESYTLYNNLIDNHNQQDTNTVFYGAVASIGANHPENAIALLELAKLIDSNNMESRYGLGLLYHEIKNFKGAAIQYSLIGNSDFKSKYFDFKITN